MADTHADALKTLNRIVSSAKIAMLTTLDEEGHPHSRPMDTHEHEFNGDLWFFSERNSRKVTDVTGNPNVNVTYSGGNSFASLVGTASIVTDVAKKRELWKEDLKAWFETGPEDPNIVLIKVSARGAEYWDGPPGGKIGTAVAAITVMLTGNEEAFGDNQKVSLK